MWVGALADLVTWGEKYPAWGFFSHLLIPTPCFITRNLPTTLLFFSEEGLEVLPFIICLKKCDWNLSWVHYGFSDFVCSPTFVDYIFSNTLNKIPCFPYEYYSNHFLPKNLYTFKKIPCTYTCSFHYFSFVQFNLHTIVFPFVYYTHVCEYRCIPDIEALTK